MQFFQSILKKIGFSRRKDTPALSSIRAFAAAKSDRLLADWVTGGGSADQDVYAALATIRARARDLEQNNDYAKRYLQLIEQNVVGPEGFTIQVAVRDNTGYARDVNEAIERAWRDFCRKEHCSVTGRSNLKEISALAIRGVARDGEIIIRKVNAGKYGIQLQVIEPDMLDEKLNQVLKNGNIIRMGIEFDQWRKPVNYYFKRVRVENELYSYTTIYENDHDVVPAGDILHLYIPDRAGQSRGISWMAQSMFRLRMLTGFEEASLVNARAAACKMGFFTSKQGLEYAPAEPGVVNMSNAEPGVFEQLPPGVDFVPYDPKFPTDQHPEFVKSTLKAIAGGLGISYTNLSNSLEDVNYSSIRAGLLEEREYYKTLQSWMIENLLQPVFELWLERGMLLGMISIPFKMRYPVLENTAFYGRRWDWVDPLKDVEAAKVAISIGMKSLQEYHAERGVSTYDVLNEIKEAAELAEEFGIDIHGEKNGTSNQPGTDQTSDDSEGERTRGRAHGRVIHQF